MKYRTHPRISVRFCSGAKLPFDYAEFSGGEIHVRLHQAESISGNVTITADVHNSSDAMVLLMLTDAIRLAASPVLPLQIKLILPYLPYARQDRKVNGGESLSLKVFCNLINTQNYGLVEVWDVHSDVGIALLDRVRHVTVTDIFNEVDTETMNQLFRPSATMLVAPDAGAAKRVGKLSEHFHSDYVQCGKTRNVADGALSNPIVYLDKMGLTKDFLIVDDICDGGRTFINLAKELRRYTSGKINLYVTHGIFSQGFDVFNGIIDTIFVANPFPSELPSNVVNLRKFIA